MTALGFLETQGHVGAVWFGPDDKGVCRIKISDELWGMIGSRSNDLVAFDRHRPYKSEFRVTFDLAGLRIRHKDEVPAMWRESMSASVEASGANGLSDVRSKQNAGKLGEGANAVCRCRGDAYVDELACTEAGASVEPVIVLELVDLDPLSIDGCWHLQCHRTRLSAFLDSMSSRDDCRERWPLMVRGSNGIERGWTWSVWDGVTRFRTFDRSVAAEFGFSRAACGRYAAGSAKLVQMMVGGKEWRLRLKKED
jgi:hypothetical protein